MILDLLASKIALLASKIAALASKIVALARSCGSFFRLFDVSYVVLPFFDDFLRFLLNLWWFWVSFGKDFGRICDDFARFLINSLKNKF